MYTLLQCKFYCFVFCNCYVFLHMLTLTAETVVTVQMVDGFKQVWFIS